MTKFDNWEQSRIANDISVAKIVAEAREKIKVYRQQYATIKDRNGITFWRIHWLKRVIDSWASRDYDLVKCYWSYYLNSALPPL